MKQKEISARLPPLVPQGGIATAVEAVASALEGGLATVGIAAMITGIFLGGALQFLWGLLHAL